MSTSIPLSENIIMLMYSKVLIRTVGSFPLKMNEDQSQITQIFTVGSNLYEHVFIASDICIKEQLYIK